MGYKGEIYNKFMESVQLAKKSIYDEDSREILSEMKVEAYTAIKSSENDLNYSTKEFNNFLNKQKES